MDPLFIDGIMLIGPCEQEAVSFLPWSPGASFGGGNIKLIAPYNVMVIRHKNKQLKEKAIRIMEPTKLDFFHTSSKNHRNRKENQ